MAEQVLAVVGATGAQGGGLVRAALRDPARRFRVRAITRDVQSAKAHALAELGAELVEATIDDAESMARAFDGADAAYCVTFYWAHLSPETELAQAQHLARAARQAGVGHVIWSTLEDTRRWVPLDNDCMPTLMGRYKVPHFDAKGEADGFFRAMELPVTFLLTSFFWENFLYFGMGPKRDQDGVLALTLPLGESKMAGIAADDIGKCALGIFLRREEFLGKTVGIAGGHLSGAEMAAAMTRALGQAVRYHSIPPAVYRGLGFPGAEDLGNMFQCYRDFAEAFCRSRDIAQTRRLNPELLDFDAWLAANTEKMPVA